MLVAGFPAGAWGTNCYVVAPARGEGCVIIDPGQDAASGVEELVREHRLNPEAVILTHGHLDHVWSVLPVCGSHDVPAFIHPQDRVLLTDPGRGLSGQTRDLLAAQLFGGRLELEEPDDVRELADGAELELAGLRLTVDHAPGHTPGSVTFRTAGAGDDPAVMFSGDLLFKDGVGRSDLPGGDPAALLASLSRVCLSREDETVVLPGHGAQTTIGRERAVNPWLRDLAAAEGTR